MKSNWSVHLGGTLAAAALASGVSATELTISHSLTIGVQSAQADFTFDDVSDTLTLVLTNTMTTNPGEGEGPAWLTGLFFNLTGAGNLTLSMPKPPSANMVKFDGTTQVTYTDADPGHFWAFRSDLTPADFGEFANKFGGGNQQYGLGSAGFDLFSHSDIIAYTPLGPRPQPAGADGGIVGDFGGVTVPSGFQIGGGNESPFVLESLELVFNLDAGFGLSNFSDLNLTEVAFGTRLEEGLLIPLPAALPMGLLGLCGIVLLRRLRKPKARDVPSDAAVASRFT